MRYDHITGLNANLENQALYIEQVIALKESEIAKLKKAAGILRGLAATEPLPDDPEITAKPLELPSVAKPISQADAYRRQNQGQVRPAVPSGQQHLENAVAGAVGGNA